MLVFYESQEKTDLFSRIVWLTFVLVNSLHWFSPILRFVQLDDKNFNQTMSFHVIKGWVCIRGLSFALDRLWYGLRAERNTLLEMLSFNFYFPLALTGPLVTSVAYKVKIRVEILSIYFFLVTQASERQRCSFNEEIDQVSYLGFASRISYLYLLPADTFD